MSVSILVPHLIGLDTRHSVDFRIDRPSDPSGKALLMCFRTPAIILTVDGLVELEPGDCIVHDPRFKQVHHSVPGASDGFRNDWVHVDYTVTKKIMRRLGLPWNKLIRPGRHDVFEPFIKRMMAELDAPDEFSDAAVEDAVFGMLLAAHRAERERSLMHTTMTVAERRHFDAMRRVRSDMLARLPERHDVRSLAKKMSLSPERFSALYRKFFKSSPISDLLDARILAARRILAYSHKTIKETACECGFEDIHYFSRLFRKKTGLSPSECRDGRAGKR